MFLPALALSAVTNLDLILCILLIGTLSALYSAIGGIEGVIWTDFAQTAFLVGAMVLSFVLIMTRLDGGVGEFVAFASLHEKFRMAEFSSDVSRDVFWVVLVGSLFSQIIPYLSDQSFTQRYATTQDLKRCSRAIMTNGFLAMINTLMFLLVGTALFVYYQKQPAALEGLPGNDAILPFFIARELPAGVAGVVVAGIFAAAQSALSTALNSTATVLVTDFFQRLGRPRSDLFWLRTARFLTLALGILAIGLAIVLALVGIESAFDTYQRIIGLTASGLCGLFLLGMLSRRANTAGAVIGIMASILCLYWVQSYTSLHVYLYAMVGIVVCAGTGYLASWVFPGQKQVPASPLISGGNSPSS